LRRECESVLAQLEKLRSVKIKTAAELLDISEEQVRALLPIKVYGPKTHRVALSDIEALQSARTLQPKPRAYQDLSGVDAQPTMRDKAASAPSATSSAPPAQSAFAPSSGTRPASQARRAA
jgi:hypothetical protein